MAVQTSSQRQDRARPLFPRLGHNRPGRSPYMYAIAFDLDTDQLKESYSGPSWQNAYFDIRRELERAGFAGRRGASISERIRFARKIVSRL